MIYLVTRQQELFTNDTYKLISIQESLDMMESWEVVQFDTETNGRDCHINKLLCIQFGNKKASIQIVVDCSTIDILNYKDVLETKFIVGQNLKFDLKFLYNYNIVPLRVYDTMIVEQLLYLGYPSYGNYGGISYSLKAIAERYLDIDIDKTTRGEIIWRGLDDSVIKYAAGDVEYLEDIMELQLQQCKNKNCLKGAKLECDFVPVISYLEWCGIKLDINKWKQKMSIDEEEKIKRKITLDNYIISKGNNSFYTINRQGDLFNGFDTTPKCNINWDSAQQVIKLAKWLGFNVEIKDKKTGEDKESVVEKQLKGQKGIDDNFLKYYFDYKEKSKECSTYGQSYINAINPNTGRIHTNFKQIGASSSRMACGSNQVNSDLAKLKHLPINKQSKANLHCGFPQLQNLPATKITREAFISEPDNYMCSCDYSALEARLGADIYNEPEMLKEFLTGSGDMHSLCAKMVFTKELEGIDVKDIAKLRPDLRKKVKSVEFAKQFGGSEFSIAGTLGCTVEEARIFSKAYDEGFKGVTDFKIKGGKFVKDNGYVLICEETGHKMYWWDHKNWKDQSKTFTQEFWESYRSIKEYYLQEVELHKENPTLFSKPILPKVMEDVSKHFKAGSKYERMALNSPTQGSGIIVLKHAMTNFFKWIIDNNLFGIVLIVNLVHDEAVIEYPKTLENTYKILKQYMEDSAAVFCKKLPIPAQPEVGSYWIH